MKSSKGIKEVFIVFLTTLFLFSAFYFIGYKLALSNIAPTPDFCQGIKESSKQCQDYYAQDTAKLVNLAIKFLAVFITFQILVLGFELRKFRFSWLNTGLTIVSSFVVTSIVLALALLAATMATDGGPSTYKQAGIFLYSVSFLAPPIVYTVFYKIFTNTRF